MVERKDPARRRLASSLAPCSHQPARVAVQSRQQLPHSQQLAPPATATLAAPLPTSPSSPPLRPSRPRLAMHAVADFCLVPMGVEVSVSKYIAECQRVLEQSGLKYELHGCQSDSPLPPSPSSSRDPATTSLTASLCAPRRHRARGRVRRGHEGHRAVPRGHPRHGLRASPPSSLALFFAPAPAHTSPLVRSPASRPVSRPLPLDEPPRGRLTPSSSSPFLPSFLPPSLRSPRPLRSLQCRHPHRHAPRQAGFARQQGRQRQGSPRVRPILGHRLVRVPCSFLLERVRLVDEVAL